MPARQRHRCAMALVISTWFWGKKYSGDYVDKLAFGVRTRLHEAHRFRVFSPLEEDVHLTERPGCFVRLRMFDPQWQASVGLQPGDRLVCLDLDMVVTGSLDNLFNRPEPFVILQHANVSNPCPFNGSVMMLRAGAHPEVWTNFSLEKASAVPYHEFPDDQGWLWHMLPNAAGWKCGIDSGIYAFKKKGWPVNDYRLPSNARLVAFFGNRDPAQYTRLPWLRACWRAA